jgi:hypothetical protein
LDGALDEAYRGLQPGDIVLLDLPGLIARGGAGIGRDALGRALHRAGFDCPLIWAGRKVLAAEAPWPLLQPFLSPAALGAGPRHFLSGREVLEPPTDRVIALARRTALPPPAARALRLSIVMPVYNERATFDELMGKLLAKRISGMEIEICVVESNSTDGTRELVSRYSDHPPVRLLLEDKPSGKGHAVRQGFALATGDIILIQDADLEYDLDDYEKLIEPIRNGRASFVLGSRHAVGEKPWQIRRFAKRHGIAELMNFGHLFFTWFLNVAFGQKLRDPFTMYKVFRRDCIHNVRFECNRFDFDHELVGKLVRNGFTPIEIDVRYHSRSFEEGKKVSFFGDPPTWIKACVKHRFSKLHIWPDPP